MRRPRNPVPPSTVTRREDITRRYRAGFREATQLFKQHRPGELQYDLVHGDHAASYRFGSEVRSGLPAGRKPDLNSPSHLNEKLRSIGFAGLR